MVPVVAEEVGSQLLRRGMVNCVPASFVALPPLGLISKEDQIFHSHSMR
jgi:hypothetical protein